MKFLRWLKNLFTKKENLGPINTPVNAPVEPLPTPIPEVGLGGITAEIIATMLIDSLIQYVGSKEKGTNTDKGGIIDRIIKTMGGRLGQPWCAYTVSFCVDQVCRKLGISYPARLYKGGSSQDFYFKSAAQYRISEPKKGAAFIHTNDDDSWTGHTGLVRGGFSSSNDSTFDTVEGNSKNMIQTRTDRDLKYAFKFVDLAQAIFDQYKKEKTAVLT